MLGIIMDQYEYFHNVKNLHEFFGFKSNKEL